MNDNTTPKLNIQSSDSMYGLDPLAINPDLNTYYNPDTGSVGNKVITPRSSNNKASLQIPIGIAPDLRLLRDGDLYNDGNLNMYQGNMVQSFPYILKNNGINGYINSTYTVSGDATTGSSQRLLTSTNSGMPYIDPTQVHAGLNIHIKCMGFLSTNASSSKYDIYFNLYQGNFYPTNPATVCSIPSTSITDNLSNQFFSIEFMATIRTIGVSGTAIGQGIFQYMDTGSLKGNAAVRTSEIAIDTTNPLGIAVEANLTSGDKITFNCTNTFIELF